MGPLTCSRPHSRLDIFANNETLTSFLGFFIPLITPWTSPASRNVYYPCGMVLAGQLSAGPAILFPSTALLQLGCPHKHTWSNYMWSWTPLPAARSCLCPACTIPALLSGPSLQERQLIPLSSQAGEQEQLHPFWKARAWSCFQHPPRSLLGVSCQLKLLLSLLSPYIPPILGPGEQILLHVGSAALFLFSTQIASLQEVWKHPKQTAPATPDRLQAVPTDVLIGSGQVPASCAGSRGQQTWGRDGQPAHRREGSELPMLPSPGRDLGTEAEPFHNPPLSQGDLQTDPLHQTNAFTSILCQLE